MVVDEHHHLHQDRVNVSSDDGDSWTVSHDMNMIDEVHTSEESDQNNQNNNHSVSSSDSSGDKKKAQSFFNLGLEAPQVKRFVVNQMDLDDNDDEWTKV